MLHRHRRVDQYDQTELSEALAELDALPGRGGLLHRGLLRALTLLAARERCSRRRDPRRYRRAVPGQPALPGSAHQPARGGRSCGLDDRPADGLPEAVGSEVVPPPVAARTRTPGRPRPLYPMPTPGTRSAALGPVDFAYLDPPYNQHRYFTNYHVWETLVRWDAPEHYGIACKRADSRERRHPQRLQLEGCDAGRRSPRSSADIEATVVVVSCNNESWLGRDELIEMCESRGPRRAARVRLEALRRSPDRHPRPRRPEGGPRLAPAQRRAPRGVRPDMAPRWGMPHSATMAPLKLACRRAVGSLAGLGSEQGR